MTNAYLTVSEAAQRLSIPVTDIEAMVARGELPALRIGAQLHIPGAAIEQETVQRMSRAALVVRDVPDQRRRPRTLPERRRQFEQVTGGLGPRQFLEQASAGELDIEDLAELILEAEELLAAERTR